MGGSSQTKTENSKTDPWAPQAGALTSAFSNAQDAYGKASQATAPTDFVAGFTPEQLANFRNAIGYANSNTTPDTTAATGTALQNAGTAATTGALTGLGSFDPTKANNPAALIDSANKYVAGQNIDAQVNDAMLNARQTARDVTLPQIAMNSANTGNVNSSRRGIAEGMVQRGLAQQATDLGSSMRGQAFKDGLGLASANANSNNEAALSALTARLTGGTNAANSGVNAGSTSISDKGALFGLAESGGLGLQSANQATLDNILKQYQSKVSSPYDALNGLMGIIGTNNWGSTSSGTSTVEKNPSAFEVIGGLLGAAGSAKTLFSDVRLKTDIKRVGTLDNGLPVYTFRYVGLPQVHMGLMAQDVEVRNPDAVELHESGFKMVDYEKAAA
jgi:hypothetical protein